MHASTFQSTDLRSLEILPSALFLKSDIFIMCLQQAHNMGKILSLNMHLFVAK